LAYLSVLASDSIPLDINTDIEICPLSVIDALTSLQSPVRSSFMVCEKTIDAQGAFFEVPAKHKGQKPILYGIIESEPVTCKNSEDNLEFP